MAGLSDWMTVAECAEVLDVPTESVHHLVNCGIVNYTIDRQFRTCVKPAQVARMLEANALARLGSVVAGSQGPEG